MKALGVATFFSVLFLLTSFAFAQEPSPSPNLCEGVGCTDEMRTCPDGFVATCPNSCIPTSGLCSSCTPSCAGHETQQPPPSSTPSPPPTNTCGNGVCDEDPVSCPADCPSGTSPPPTSSCGDGICNEDPLSCPGDCPTSSQPPAVCGNNVCEGGNGENSFSCPQDCGKQGPSCPQTTTCPNGQQVQCTVQADQCRCDCPLPPECRKVVAEDGSEHVFCESPQPVCSPVQKEVHDKCTNSGGRIEMRKQPNGCGDAICVFHEEEGGGFFGGPQQCPDPRGIEQKCGELGQETRYRFDRGCKIGFCVAKEEKTCPEDNDPSLRKRLIDECKDGGGDPAKGFDPQGCEITACKHRGEQCQRDIPDQAYVVCQQEKGGEMVVDRDENGCITFANCVHRGQGGEIAVKKIDRVPSAAKLLDIALKLEDVTQKIDQIIRKLKDLAAYYESVGSSDKNRFLRAAGILEGAKEKINGIKSTLRDRLNGLTTEDVEKAVYQLREVTDNAFKDAVYYMLSTSDEAVKEGELQQQKEGAVDESDFSDAFAECRPVTFHPEPGVLVQLDGLDDQGNCIMKAQGKFGGGPDMEMTCAIPSDIFSQGIQNAPGPHEMDEWHCKGSMADAIRSGSGPQGGIPEEARAIMKELGCSDQASCGRACQQQGNFNLCRRLKQIMGGGTQGPPSGQQFQPPQTGDSGPDGGFGSGGEFAGGEFSSSSGEFGEGISPPPLPGSQEGFTGRIASCLGCQNDGYCGSKECAVCKDCGGTL